MTAAPADWIAAARRGDAAGEIAAASASLGVAAAVDALCEAATDALRTDLDVARRLVEAAQSLASESRDARLLGLATRSEAMLLWASNRYAPALQRFEAALVEFERCGDELEGARTRSNALQTLIYLSRYDEATQWAESARAVFERHGEPLRLARLDGNRANLLYRQDRLEEAIALYEEIEERFAALGRPRDIAAVLRNKAVCQLGLSQFDAALDTHRRARAFCEAHGMEGLAAECDYTIANLHYQRGDYLLARSLYQDARRAAARLGDEYHVALCDLDEAELLLDLNLTEDAATSARRATRVFRRLGLDFEATKSRVFAALADAASGSTRSALRALAEAQRQFVREGNALWPPLLDLYRALLLEKAGSFAAARRRAQAALAVLSGSLLPSKAAHGHLLLARLALKRGDTERALGHLADARQVLPQAQSPALDGHASYVGGLVCELRGEASAAIELYRLAQREFEALRDRLRTDDLRVAFLNDKIDVYDAHFALLIEAGDRDGAFAVAERAKSQGLLATIAARRPQRVADAPGSGRERLEFLYHALDTLEVSPEVSERHRAQAVRRQIRDAEAALRAERLGRDAEAGSVTSLDVAEVQAALPRDTTLLKFFGARGRFHGFAIDANGLHDAPLGRVDDVARMLRFLQFQLERARTGGESRPAALLALRGHLQELHDALLAPLRGRVKTPHCIVSPHGLLHGLPFHALHDGHDFLGDLHTFSVAPSAAVLLKVLRTPPPVDGAPAVFGVADEAAPQILDECRRIAAALPGARLHLDGAATQQRLREVGHGASILHIASHGRFRRDNPWFSALKLGDGYLTLHDLHGMRLDVGLAVLSGCATGQGVVSGGDETVGLARGLLQAGVRTAVLSLWEVNDASARLWMEAFYGRLAAGDSAQRAAQAAAATTRESHPHPYHWAPFIVYGRPGVVHLSTIRD